MSADEMAQGKSVQKVLESKQRGCHGRHKTRNNRRLIWPVECKYPDSVRFTVTKAPPEYT